MPKRIATGDAPITIRAISTKRLPTSRGHPTQPENAQAYYSRGFAYREKGDFDKAIADHTEAIRLNPKYASAYHNRGTTYSKKGDHDKAIADYTEAIRLEPEILPVRITTGAYAYFEEGRF